METPIVSSLNFQGINVRVAFDKDAYVFLEDAERLHQLFSETSLLNHLDPNDIFTILVIEKGNDLIEQRVIPTYKLEGIICNSLCSKSDNHRDLQIFLMGIQMAHSDLIFLEKNKNNYPLSRNELLEKAYRSKFSAEVDVINNDFFINFWSKSPEEIATFKYVDPAVIPPSRWSHVNSSHTKEAPIEAPVA